ncbi:hypothetical protein F4802DRAFT_575758 [Xylaria palmicola]|nr:hypothetical protein F4802DRAFT_575758 [Xylaria palmicola]
MFYFLLIGYGSQCRAGPWPAAGLKAPRANESYDLPPNPNPDLICFSLSSPHHARNDALRSAPSGRPPAGRHSARYLRN